MTIFILVSILLVAAFAITMFVGGVSYEPNSQSPAKRNIPSARTHVLRLLLLRFLQYRQEGQRHREFLMSGFSSILSCW